MLQSCVQSSIDENNRHGMVIFMLIFDKAFLVGAVMTPVRDRYTPAIAMVAAEAIERNAATKICPADALIFDQLRMHG